MSGETGCGKTTQLPQMLLEDAIRRGAGPATNIVCTQPRRISAVSIAQRVAQERGEAVGGTIGYRIRLEAKASPATRLLFCTSGVLLRRLTVDENISTVSHVIVDEVPPSPPSPPPPPACAAAVPVRDCLLWGLP